VSEVIYRLPDCPGCGRGVGAADAECPACGMPAEKMARLRAARAEYALQSLKAADARRARAAEFAAHVNARAGVPRRPAPEQRLPQPRPRARPARGK
jgi:hypothetical protein